jgi:hypothetical protein
MPAFLRDQQDIDWMVEAVESVLKQTIYCKLIIVENGSDFLPDVEGPISIIHSDKGLSRARNAGIRKSNTEYFFPLDCNDFITPGAIEALLKNMPEGKGFVYGSTIIFRGIPGSGDQVYYTAKPYIFQEVMKMVYFPNGALQRKSSWELAGGYRESLVMLEDWDYWLTSGERGICGKAIPDEIYWYRQHAGIVGTNGKSPEWAQTMQLIRSYHQPIYKGVYPPMCCGSKTSKKSNIPWTPPVQLINPPGADGMILIEYIGNNAGTSSWYGPVTRTRYVAGGSKRKFYIDPRDAFTGNRKALGLLELTDHGNPLFREAVLEEEPA